MIELFDNEESFLSFDDESLIVEEIDGEFGQTCYQIVDVIGNEMNDRFEKGEVLNDSMIDDLLELGVNIEFESVNG